MLKLSASNVTLNMNETTLWAITVFRIVLDVTGTSDTCEVMPMTKEK